MFDFIFGARFVLVSAASVYTDCERPPTILHGKTELSVDDQGIVVIASYSCDKGFQLIGESEIFCNTDTDEWQSTKLPACKQGKMEFIGVCVLCVCVDRNEMWNIIC